MCRGGPALGVDKASRIERWGVATDEELQAAVKQPGLMWLDVRTVDEVTTKSLPASLKVVNCNVTMFNSKELEEKASSLLPKKDAPILVFCAVGGRAAEAHKCLLKMGYTGTITNAGGIADLESAVPDVLEAAAKKSVKKKGGSCCVQ